MFEAKNWRFYTLCKWSIVEKILKEAGQMAFVGRSLTRVQAT
jgi:hypothetical protein